MKRMMMMAMCALSLPTFAYDCTNLKVTFVNETSHECSLRRAGVFNGHYVSYAPIKIASQSVEAPFYLGEYDAGIEVEFDYRCDDKVLIFGLKQDSCFLVAGDISAYQYEGSDLRTKYEIETGSYWSSTPGEIKVTIYED